MQSTRLPRLSRSSLARTFRFVALSVVVASAVTGRGTPAEALFCDSWRYKTSVPRGHYLPPEKIKILKVETGVATDYFRKKGEFRKLFSIRVNDVSETAQIMKDLGANYGTQLRFVQITNANALSSDAVSALRNFSVMRDLWISFPTESLKELSESIPASCSKITFFPRASFIANKEASLDLPEVKELEFSCATVNQDFLMRSNFPKVTRINLAKCIVESGELQDLSGRFPELKEVEIGTTKYPDGFLRIFGKTCKIYSYDEELKKWNSIGADSPLRN